jgi:hypothetical protein
VSTATSIYILYLKEDILKLTDNTITFAVSSLQADELKKYLPPGEKICEFVYDVRERSHSFKTASDFSKTGLSSESGTVKTHQTLGLEIKPDYERYNILGNKKTEIDFSQGTNNISFILLLIFLSVVSALNFRI